MTITLPPELAAKIRVRRESAGIQTDEELVVEALRAWDEQEERFAEIRAKVAAGFAELDQGLGLPLDLDDFLRRANERIGASAADAG